MPKYSKADREASLAQLREWINPGDTVHTALVHVSRSGMMRHIAPMIFINNEADNRRYLTYHVAVVLGLPIKTGWQDAVKVGGCGMDMGFHLVYNLSRALWPDGFPCTGVDAYADRRRCPSNDHSNGDRDYTAGKMHSDGGYALHHRWI